MIRTLLVPLDGSRFAERALSVASPATHGRTGMRRAVLGSVADKVIRGATMPVLVSPAHGEPSR